MFTDIFDALRDDGLFEGTIKEIENSDLFKLSPFKALTKDRGGGRRGHPRRPVRRPRRQAREPDRRAG
ncbi:hypothetical protein [Nocardioides sp. B-3]|uniref:hypothetical protein n=1 Tax=Nocardioides sp. B-3 TaxID=2895565 RepID=UPI002152963B|nr:hypothetical protein [Nocardioides sp. B-3]UUZ59457.1 hypothetical protein LP418_27360 [Nocardioides sp. B-3]